MRHLDVATTRSTIFGYFNATHSARLSAQDGHVRINADLSSNDASTVPTVLNVTASNGYI